MAARYTHNYSAFGQLVLRAGFMEADMRTRAEKVKDRFEQTAPRRTNRYAESARVESGRRGGPHNDRAFGRVVVDHPAAMAIEFGHTTEGGTHVDGSHTLTQALDAAGD